MDKRRRLVAGSVGLATSNELDVELGVIAAPVGASAAADEQGDSAAPLATEDDAADAGTDSRSCEPLMAVGALDDVVSGSERQSPEFSRDTSMPGSRVSMWVKLFERPCNGTKNKHHVTLCNSSINRTSENFFELVLARLATESDYVSMSFQLFQPPQGL